MSRPTRGGTAKPVRETIFSGANADREIFIFTVQLTTCKIGNLTRLIHTLAICVTIHIYIIELVCASIFPIPLMVNKVDMYGLTQCEVNENAEYMYPLWRSGGISLRNGRLRLSCLEDRQYNTGT